jgi:ATP/maltotriose-dependent transcriptional regulator MalT
VETLRRVRTLEAAQGVGEPSVLRWHTDLASGLIALGELNEAEETLRMARETIAHRTRNAGVVALLDRAEALLRAERGDIDAAVDLVAARRAGLPPPADRAGPRTVGGQVECRRRRYAAARAAVSEALALFTQVGAKPWAEQAARTLSRVDGTEPASAPSTLARERSDISAALSTLTTTEARIATMVREGASNREIATRMFLSVKTVEAR